MGTIKEEAKNYAPTSTIKNITELPAIDVDLVVFEDLEAEFPYKFIEIDDNRYKMPVSVLNSLKSIIAAQPELKKFKVVKSGKGMDTRYVVIPLVG